MNAQVVVNAATVQLPASMYVMSCVSTGKGIFVAAFCTEFDCDADIAAVTARHDPTPWQDVVTTWTTMQYMGKLHAALKQGALNTFYFPDGPSTGTPVCMVLTVTGGIVGLFSSSTALRDYLNRHPNNGYSCRTGILTVY